MRPVSAPAVDTGGTSSASVELPTPLNALTGSAGPLGMGRRRRSTGGRRGQRRWGADAGTDVDELDQLAGSLDRHADSLQPAEDFDVAVLPYDVRCDRDLLRAFAAEADTPRGGHWTRSWPPPSRSWLPSPPKPSSSELVPTPPPAPLFQTPAAVVATDGQTLMCQ
jgi:hypothetical protein